MPKDRAFSKLYHPSVPIRKSHTSALRNHSSLKSITTILFAARFIRKMSVNQFFWVLTGWLTLFHPGASAQELLNYFKANVNRTDILLDWEMTMGNTCNGIQIWHSVDQQPFQLLHEISGICGSKTETVRYQYFHHQPAVQKMHRYQLLFGNLGQSEILEVFFRNYTTGFQLNPSPVSQLSKLYFIPGLSPHRLRIFNLDGNEIYFRISSEDCFEISVQDYLNGLYFFEILDDQQKQVAAGVIPILKQP